MTETLKFSVLIGICEKREPILKNGLLGLRGDSVPDTVGFQCHLLGGMKPQGFSSLAGSQTCDCCFSFSELTSSTFISPSKDFTLSTSAVPLHLIFQSRNFDNLRNIPKCTFFRFLSPHVCLSKRIEHPCTFRKVSQSSGIWYHSPSVSAVLSCLTLVLRALFFFFFGLIEHLRLTVM